MARLNKKYSDFQRFLSPAKINLFLRILNKRKDGYHNLQSVFQLIDLYDEVFIRARSDNKILIDYNVNSIDKNNDLGLKAANLMLKNLNYGVDIKINKKIPIGGGLGGGSSNAASVMLGINKLFNLNIDKKKLTESSLSIGADVPFFVNGINGWVEGVGESITPLHVNNNKYLLIIPNISISTRRVFTDFKLTNKPITLKIPPFFNEVEDDNIVNDLQDIVLENYPKLNELFIWLQGFGKPSMTGTGSTFFLKYDDIDVARKIIDDKPKDIKIISVKGISLHPHFLAD